MIQIGVRLVSELDLHSYSWAHLRRFHNVMETTSILMDLHRIPLKQKGNAEKQAHQIRYCLQQAREYADAADTVSLATKANLLYYSIMSLALAEILFKQSGESSLDRAREQHKHHGLQLKVSSVANGELEEQARSLRAVPLEHANGDRFGTFELWHRTCREAPAAGKLKEYRGEGYLSSFALILGAEDAQLPKLPSAGISLLDCMLHIPGMHEFFSAFSITSPIVRGSLELKKRETGEQLKMIFHPCPDAVWTEFSSRISFSPRDLECIRVTGETSGCSIDISNSAGSSVPFQLPHGSMITTNEIMFWCDRVPLNEFGFFYVGLYILGNYVRYFPDKWLLDVEKSTRLVLAVEKFLSEVRVRAPFLALSELTRVYHIPGRLQ